MSFRDKTPYSTEFSGNLNDIRTNCVARVEPVATNNPLPNLGQYSQYGLLICIGYKTGSGNESYYQIIGNYNLLVGDLYIRGENEGSWKAWKK